MQRSSSHDLEQPVPRRSVRVCAKERRVHAWHHTFIATMVAA
jgi:hypothetical protein